MKLVPDDYEILRNDENKINSRTQIRDHNYNIIFSLDKSFTNTQIKAIVSLINYQCQEAFIKGKTEAQMEVRQALGIFEFGTDRVDIGESTIYLDS